MWFSLLTLHINNKNEIIIILLIMIFLDNILDMPMISSGLIMTDNNDDYPSKVFTNS